MARYLHYSEVHYEAEHCCRRVWQNKTAPFVRTRKQRGRAGSRLLSLPGPALNDLLDPTRSCTLKFPPPPKIVSPAGDPDLNI